MKKARDVFFVFLEAAGLVLKRHYSGPDRPAKAGA
jgi:hypothetical protein